MRRYLLYFTPVLLYCFLISTIANSQVQKIYIHPKAPGNGKQSQFVDSIRFIPLTVQEGVQIGAYTNVTVTQKYFIITDFPGKTVLLYAKNGSFIKKINYKQLGETFYPNYDERKNQIVFFGNNKNYTLTSKDKVSILLDWSNPRNKKYFRKFSIDLTDTSFAIKKDIPAQSDIIRANHYYDDFYLEGQIVTSTLYQDSLGHELKLYKSDQLVKSFFPYNRINEPKYLYGSEETVSTTSTDVPYIQYITRPYCDTIYKMVKDSLFPVYQLVLPLENSLPHSFFTRPFKNKTERDNFRRNNGWMLRQVYSFYETPAFIFFLVRYQSNFESYIYQKQTNTTYKTKNIKPDSSQYNLQLLVDFGVARKGDRFYKTLKASDLLTFFQQNKNIPPPKELESFLQNNPGSTTPVIVEFKLKN